MQVIRTIVWVVLLIALLIFSINNWDAVAVEGRITVKIWEDLVLETRLPALVVLSFLLGLVPMWLLHVVGKWRLKRRIGALEAVTRQPSAALTSTQLEAAQPAPVAAAIAADPVPEA
jgi:uncharacterized membrane protein